MKNFNMGIKGMLLGVGIIALTGCGDKSEAVEVAAVKSVKVLTVSEEQYHVSLDYQGYMTAKETKNLSFESNGKVRMVYVEQGQRVQKGDVLVTLDTTTLETTIANEGIKLQSLINTYESSISAAQMNYNRQKTLKDNMSILYGAGDISRQDYDDIVFAYNSAANDLDNLTKKRDNDIILQESLIADYQRQLEHAVLTAPADGYVTSVNTKADEIISYGSPAVSLQSEDKVIKIGVSVDDFQLLSTGMSVIITANNQKLEGRVTRIELAPDSSAHTYTVDIVPEDNELPIGTLVEAKISLETKRGIFIPISAVVSSNGVNYIYLLEASEHDGYETVIKREITVSGTIYEDKILVENMEPGKRIISEGVKNIRENEVVVAVE
ncbi:MAG: efflux RND transporter periplasmic adaptor subunit [Lachnospiraceae bacterium]